MNKLIIIGNLTRDPELKTTPNGKSVCEFTVAVNRRRNSNGQQDVDYFRVTAWNQQAENCHKYLAKGRKCSVVGPVSARAYTANDGTARVSLEVTAEDVEFLSSRNESQGSGSSYGGYNAAPAPSAPQALPQQPGSVPPGFTAVETDELPF